MNASVLCRTSPFYVKKKCAKRFIIDGDELKTFTIILMISNQI